MFNELTCFGGAKNLVLATTMWDKLNPKLDNGNEWETRLKEKIGKDMIDHGATVERFLNTSDSAWRIVHNIVNRNDEEAPLLIQRQILDQKIPFTQTSAGKALDLGFRQLIPRQSSESL